MSWKQFRGLVVAQSQVPSRAVRSIDNEIRGLPQRDCRAAASVNEHRSERRTGRGRARAVTR
jgi:hypothetical protein